MRFSARRPSGLYLVHSISTPSSSYLLPNYLFSMQIWKQTKQRNMWERMKRDQRNRRKRIVWIQELRANGINELWIFCDRDCFICIKNPRTAMIFIIKFDFSSVRKSYAKTLLTWTKTGKLQLYFHATIFTTLQKIKNQISTLTIPKSQKPRNPKT